MAERARARGGSPREPAKPASTGAFERDTAVERVAGGETAGAQGSAGRAVQLFGARVSGDWRAGRGPHGGYIAAIILRALCEAVADGERAPRSLTIHYARAPQPGAVQIEVTEERRGRSLSTMSARMQQDGRLIALALAAFSVAWEAPELSDTRMPEVAPPEAQGTTLAPLEQLIERGLAPQFLRHLVVQPRLGEMPFGGARAPMLTAAWLGLRDAARPLDQIALALFCDALYSPPFVRLEAPATSPTIDLTIHFRSSRPAAHLSGTHGLCFAQFRSRRVHEGFFEEDGEIYAPDGTLLAQSRQLAILLPLRSDTLRADG